MIDYSRIKSHLLNSGVHRSNNALFQSVLGLIDSSVIFNDFIQSQNGSQKNPFDSGNALCDSGDIDGTEITFNHSFLVVDSIIAVAINIDPRTVTIDFDFTQNHPNSFHAFVYDNVGVRTDDRISWLAHGKV